MKLTKELLKRIFNIVFRNDSAKTIGAISFILGISLFIILLFEVLTGKPLNMDVPILLILAILLFVMGIVITRFNQDRSEYKVSPLSKQIALRSSLEIGMNTGVKSALGSYSDYFLSISTSYSSSVLLVVFYF